MVTSSKRQVKGLVTVIWAGKAGNAPRFSLVAQVCSAYCGLYRVSSDAIKRDAAKVKGRNTKG